MLYAWTVINSSSLPLITCPTQFRIFVVHLFSPPLAIDLGTENWVNFWFHTHHFSGRSNVRWLLKLFGLLFRRSHRIPFPKRVCFHYFQSLIRCYQCSTVVGSTPLCLQIQTNQNLHFPTILFVRYERDYFFLDVYYSYSGSMFIQIHVVAASFRQKNKKKQLESTYAGRCRPVATSISPPSFLLVLSTQSVKFSTLAAAAVVFVLRSRLPSFSIPFFFEIDRRFYYG